MQRYNSGASAQWEAKRGCMTPEKRMRKAANFQFLAPIYYEDQLHFWAWSQKTPLSIFKIALSKFKLATVWGLFL